MNRQTELTTMLSLIQHPAFCVRNGCIILCNSAAERMLIQQDTPVSHLLGSNISTYEQFQNGCLYLSLTHNNHSLSASVTQLDDVHVFVVEADAEQTELKTLSLAATALRHPVSSVIATMGNLTPILENEPNSKAADYFAQVNRQLWRIHRMLCNMSDTARYCGDATSHMVCQNITAIASEVFQKAQQLAEHCGITFNYSIPTEKINCLVDEQLLERSIYNMISNALKVSQEGSIIEASLTCRDQRLYLSVADQGIGIPANLLGNVFHHYRRQPGIEDGLNGLGLGMALIRCAAKIHNGTVLLDRPKGFGTRVTLSFPIQLGRDTIVSSGVINVDYAGGWEHGLLELSDVLPAHLYASK